LLQKQTRFDLEWSTEVSFDPSRAGEEAGTVVWLTTTTYAAIGVRGDGDGRLHIVFRRPDESYVMQVSGTIDIGGDVDFAGDNRTEHRLGQ
jgi:hypothetical protein